VIGVVAERGPATPRAGASGVKVWQPERRSRFPPAGGEELGGLDLAFSVDESIRARLLLELLPPVVAEVRFGASS